MFICKEYGWSLDSFPNCCSTALPIYFSTFSLNFAKYICFQFDLQISLHTILINVRGCTYQSLLDLNCILFFPKWTYIAYSALYGNFMKTIIYSFLLSCHHHPELQKFPSLSKTEKKNGKIATSLTLKLNKV